MSGSPPEGSRGGDARPIAAQPLLDVDRLTVRFGGLVAVSDLDLEVPKGSVVSVIGPNGAGKTTAFNCISGIYAPTSGTVRFHGRRLERAFTPRVFWSALGLGLLTALLFGLAGSLDDALKAWARLRSDPVFNRQAGWSRQTWAILAEIAIGGLETDGEDGGGPALPPTFEATLSEVQSLQTRALLILLAFFAFFATGAWVSGF